MAQRSAGILLYRRAPALEVLLVHPGGPYWVNKDDGAWSIPKGLYERGEAAEAAARREVEEETGRRVPEALTPLGAFRQPSGKIIEAWAAEGDFDVAEFRSNLFSMEWPPRSGRLREFPEADRAAWFAPEDALRKVVKGQRPIVRALLQRLANAK